MIWIHATTGRGPEECDFVLQYLLQILSLEAGTAGLTCVLLDCKHSNHGLTSFLVAIEGDEADRFGKTWNGTMQWVCPSHIRKNHKRKRWFVKFEVITPLTENDITISQSDLVWESFRSSGPGGQHVQKTNSAVRLTHKPSGVVITAQEERSQHRNKSLAMGKLMVALSYAEDVKKSQSDKDKWQAHNTLERGNAIRTFNGMDFKEAK